MAWRWGHAVLGLGTAAVSAALALTLGGCTGLTGDAAGTGPAASGSVVAPAATPTDATPDARTGGSVTSGSVTSGSATTTRAGLTVKGRAARTGYQRSQFGDGWVDTDRNGCDTRNDILRRDATGVTLKPGTHGCVVASGTLQDRYSGTALPFARGDGAVQIDHVVALSDAWQKGAQGWSAEQRTAFANDPLNLVATGSATNQQKGDGDAATWLPPYRPGRCAYVARQVAVKAKYGLWVTSAEWDAMGRVLAACPGEGLPTGADRPPS